MMETENLHDILRIFPQRMLLAIMENDWKKGNTPGLRGIGKNCDENILHRNSNVKITELSKEEISIFRFCTDFRIFN